MIAAPITLCVLATGSLIWAEWRGHDAPHAGLLRGMSKSIAAFSFLVTGWFAGLSQGGALGAWGLAALALCLLGDLALLSRARHWFLAGLVFFLLGHVGYVGAFLTLGLAPLGLGLGALLLLPVAAVVWRWLSPSLPAKMRAPVMAYVAVITTMVVCAVGAWVAQPGPLRLGLLVAAVVFFLSDLCVARDRFVSPGFPNRLLGLPLYFGAQLGFATALGALAG